MTPFKERASENSRWPTRYCVTLACLARTGAANYSGVNLRIALGDVDGGFLQCSRCWRRCMRLAWREARDRYEAEEDGDEDETDDGFTASFLASVQRGKCRQSLAGMRFRRSRFRGTDARDPTGLAPRTAIEGH